jgi:hypothetical protein
MIQNDKKNVTDFFGEIDSRDAHLTTPDALSAQDYTEQSEDKAVDERLRRVIADIDEIENELAEKSEDYGELPFDEGADRERWERLENEFTELLNREAAMKKSEDVKNDT